MKRIKKKTFFTRSRDCVRALFALSFYSLVLIPHCLGYRGFEIETEYIVILSVIIFGPWFCGWACPFGNASYFMTKLGSKVFPKLQFVINNKLHNILKYLKYILFLYFLGIMILKGVNYFGDHMVMYQTNAFTQFYIKFKHVAVLLIPLFIPRFYCKYLCFAKPAYNLINYIIPNSRITRDESTCINCKKCDKVCPMQLNLATNKEIKGTDCISCFNCLDKDVCPTDSLNLYIWKRKVKPTRFGNAIFLAYIILTYIAIYIFSI